MKSMFEACCTTQQPINGQQPMPVPNQTASTNAVYAQPGVQQESGMQKAAKPMTNLLAKVEEKVPMVAPFASNLRGAIQTGVGSAPEVDMLKANVITGQGEETQSFGDAIHKHRMPTVGIFPANSKTGLSALRALTGYPNRNTCAKIHCIVRDENAIPMVRGELNEHLTDSISFSFADYTDPKQMAQAFMGIDRLLVVPPSTPDRAELVCNGLYAAKLAGVPHIILLSAVVAQHPNTLFGKQFRRMEECLEGMQGHLSYTIMRMAWFMDNFLDMAADIVSNNRFLSSWGPSAVSAVSLGDIGRCAAVVLSGAKDSPAHHGRTYHLTGPESLSGFRMAEVFSKVLGKQIAYQDLPREEMKKVYLEGMKVEEWQANGYIEMNELFKSGAGAAYSTDVAMLTGGNHTTLERFLRCKRWYFAGERSPLICVLPASGRVGTNTLAALMRDKSHGRIRAVVRRAEHRAELEARFPKATRLEIVTGDLEQPQTIAKAFEGVDSLLLIPPEKVERFSVIDETIKAAYAAGVGHVILFSVSKALDATAIGRKFNAWERVLEQNAHSYTIIQSSLFQDLMFVFADQIKQPERRVHHWLGNGMFCPVDARDVGEACAAVLREGPIEHQGRTYSLYGPQALNFGQMTQILSKVLGYEITATPDITSEQVRATMQGKLPSFNVEEVIQAHECVAKGTDIARTPDLLRLTGQARTIQAFFEDYKTYFENRGGFESRRPMYDESKMYTYTSTTSGATQQPTSSSATAAPPPPPAMPATTTTTQAQPNVVVEIEPATTAMTSEPMVKDIPAAGAEHNPAATNVNVSVVQS